jgi:uncharacterized OB-fold protein
VSDNCLSCGEALAGRQRWCLRCGVATATTVATAPRWAIRAAAAGALSLLALAGIVYALATLVGA